MVLAIEGQSGRGGVAPGRPSVSVLLLLTVQLALAGLVVYLYEIEGPVFLRLFALACAGFAINQFLRHAWKLPFFVLLSFVGVFLVFGVGDGLWLIGCGLALIGTCHLGEVVA